MDLDLYLLSTASQNYPRAAFEFVEHPCRLMTSVHENQKGDWVPGPCTPGSEELGMGMSLDDRYWPGYVAGEDDTEYVRRMRDSAEGDNENSNMGPMSTAGSPTTGQSCETDVDMGDEPGPILNGDELGRLVSHKTFVGSRAVSYSLSPVKQDQHSAIR